MDVTPVQPFMPGPQATNPNPRTTLPAASPPASKAPLLNPDPVIDARLGIVVMQYFNRDGDVTSTTPSPRQLQAYSQAAGKTEP